MVPVMGEDLAMRREVVPMNILIVDDEMSIREACATVSEQCGMKAVAVATADGALQVLEHSAIDILLTDLKLQQSSGVDLLKQVHDLHPEVAAVVLTQYGTIESAMEVTRMGAVDYVTKPFRIEELQQENRLLREQLRTRPGFGGLIGVSMKMQRVYKMIEKVSQHEYPVRGGTPAGNDCCAGGAIARNRAPVESGMGGATASGALIENRNRNWKFERAQRGKRRRLRKQPFLFGERCIAS
jgi:CheY-like chemotaxis protein